MPDWDVTPITSWVSNTSHSDPLPSIRARISARCVAFARMGDYRGRATAITADAEETHDESTALLRTRGRPSRGRARARRAAPARSSSGCSNCSTCGTDVKIFYNGHQNLTPPRTIGHEIAGEVVEVGADVERDLRQRLAGRRPRPGDRRGALRRVPRVPQGLDGGLPEPDLGRLPVRRRLRGVHDRPAAGAQGGRAQPDPRQRRVRRGLGRRAVRLRHQRPGADGHRGGRHRRRLRRRPDRLHAHPDRPRRAQGRHGLPRRRQRRAARRCRPTPSSPTRPSTAPRSTSSSGSWS